VIVQVSAYMSEARNHLSPDGFMDKKKHHVLDTFAAMISGFDCPHNHLLQVEQGQVLTSPSAVSEARIDGRMMCGQAAPARFRYSDLMEVARRRTRALWGLNGMEGWCPGVSGCCRGARKTTADALELGETQDGRGIKIGEAGKTRIVEEQGTERLRAPRHAKIS
jgi:hypothetical protein